MTLQRDRRLGVLAVLVLFFGLGALRHLRVGGPDLSSSYVGCRVVAAGEKTHLYSHDSTWFNVVGDPLWTDVADKANFRPLSLLHPYVQTPLWAYLLQPLCTRTNFPVFNAIFKVLESACFAGTLWLIASCWTLRLFHPGWIAVICALFYVSQPFRYAMVLSQTHIIFIFLTLLALVLAKERPALAGLLLAVAAAVKVTPAVLFLYWLFTRQKKAALSFLGSSLAIVAVTLLTTGTSLWIAYWHQMSEISNVLLLAFNNQSFAAWWMSYGHKVDLFTWRIYPLPSVLKYCSLLLVAGCTVAGGVMDRMSGLRRVEQRPYGAIFALLGATIFTPIAWNHYYILLIVPVLMLLNEYVERRSFRWLAFAVAIYCLNLYPIAFDAVSQRLMSFSLLRSQFYSGVISLAALALLYASEQRRESKVRGTSMTEVDALSALSVQA